MTDTPKQRYGLLGHNISYSLSPVMHNAAFKHFDISASYDIFDVPENGLDEFFENYVLNGKLNGFNVTVPYKEKVYEMMCTHSSWKCYFNEPVEKGGTLNTVNVTTSGLFGDNTDFSGFLGSLAEDVGFISKNSVELPKNTSVFVAGAGGAGRPISIFLAIAASSNGGGRVEVYDPDASKIESLRTIVQREGCLENIFMTTDKKDMSENIPRCDLVVNATPLGTKKGDPLPFDPDMLKDGAVVYDLVYARETELVTRARARGLTAVNGLGMLVNQGALAFEIWTDKPYEEVRKVMRDAAEKALKGAA